MKFSLLIAFYNNFIYFKDCYKSICNQSYQNFEVILVDDGSEINEIEQLKELIEQDKRFHLFQNDQNKGVGYSKNRCVSLAKGEICGFIDPDDMLEESALELSVKAYHNPEVVATYSFFGMFDDQMNFVKPFKWFQKVPSFQKNFFNINFEMNHFFTFRKSIYDLTDKINPNLSSAVDQDLYLKMYEMGEIYYINQSLYKYRLHQKGVSQDKSKKVKLNQNWHQVLMDTMKRRQIKQLFGRNVLEIDNLPQFIFENENTFWKKLKRKFYSFSEK